MISEPSALDRALAKVCEHCPVCQHARRHQKGMVFDFVKNVEQGICPFCKAYERVHRKKAHEKR
jgi:transposase-like protein